MLDRAAGAAVRLEGDVTTTNDKMERVRCMLRNHLQGLFYCYKLADIKRYILLGSLAETRGVYGWVLHVFQTYIP
jgi:hypothetical protein